jgi:2-dehydro-3-deoxygalactonokinase
MNGPFIGVDWGTTNRRAYRIENGRVTRVERDSQGILAIAPEDFARQAAALRTALGDLPVLCVGMVGSRRGWREIPYMATPASAAKLAAGIQWVAPGVAAIAPGVSHRTAERCDVMRGEEVQFLGAVAAGLAPAGRMLCQPGTHSKWTRVENAQIGEFSTAMTGELYALLRQHSLLKEMLEGEVALGTAFFDGVLEGRKLTTLSSLFGARAAQLLDARRAADGASFVSGLLIASDVQSHLHGAPEEVYVIGDAPLAPLYSAAIEHLGGRAQLIDSAAAFVAGVSLLWELAE